MESETREAVVDDDARDDHLDRGVSNGGVASSDTMDERGHDESTTLESIPSTAESNDSGRSNHDSGDSSSVMPEGDHVERDPGDGDAISSHVPRPNDNDESQGSSDAIAANVKEPLDVETNQASNSTTTGNNAIVEKLERELALSNTHRMQLQSHWRQVLSKEKFQELHDGVPKLVEYHDHSIVRKKDVIKAIEGEVHHLQELFQDAMVANMNRMEDLIAIHDDRVVRLERDFRDRVSSLQCQFRIDVEEINTRYRKEKELKKERIDRQADDDEVRLRAMKHQERIDRQADDDEVRLRAMKQDLQHELEEIRNRNLEHVNGLRFVMDSRTEDLGERFDQAHSEFAQNTDGARAAYEQLRSKDEAMRREVEGRTRRANEIQKEIQRFRLIAKQEEAQIEERRRELLARKSRAIARWNSTQEDMTKFRDEQQKRLVDMIRRANEQKEGLRQQCELAVRVRKIAEACQNWESSRERFASLLRVTTSPYGQPEEGEEDDQSPIEKVDECRSYIVDCMGRLGDTTHHFWDKYNIAKLDVLTLEKEVRRLKERELDLKKKLKMYQDGITVNNDVLKDRNPLFVINGKMNAMPNGNAQHAGGKKRVMRRLTVVDGNHFFATNSLTQVA
ncbi:hypothetical protein ACHAWF_012856 [Thalassiosira exigua]